MISPEGTGLGVLGLALLGFVWKLGEDFTKYTNETNKKINQLDEETNKKIVQSSKEGEQKTSRIYERMDEVKTRAEEKFVRKDLCEILHKNLTDKVDHLNLRVETGFKSLSEKIDKVLERKQ